MMTYQALARGVAKADEPTTNPPAAKKSGENDKEIVSKFEFRAF